MKARRGKRSEVRLNITMLWNLFFGTCRIPHFILLQAFWPSIVMKKWLNIKPKVNDFSEDEVDTETESEDDGML